MAALVEAGETEGARELLQAAGAGAQESNAKHLQLTAAELSVRLGEGPVDAVDDLSRALGVVARPTFPVTGTS